MTTVAFIDIVMDWFVEEEEKFWFLGRSDANGIIERPQPQRKHFTLLRARDGLFEKYGEDIRMDILKNLEAAIEYLVKRGYLTQIGNQENLSYAISILGREFYEEGGYEVQRRKEQKKAQHERKLLKTARQNAEWQSIYGNRLVEASVRAARASTRAAYAAVIISAVTLFKCDSSTLIIPIQPIIVTANQQADSSFRKQDPRSPSNEIKIIKDTEMHENDSALQLR